MVLREASFMLCNNFNVILGFIMLNVIMLSVIHAVSCIQCNSGCHNAEYRYTLCCTYYVMLYDVILSAIMLSVA